MIWIPTIPSPVQSTPLKLIPTPLFQNCEQRIIHARCTTATHNHHSSLNILISVRVHHIHTMASPWRSLVYLRRHCTDFRKTASGGSDKLVSYYTTVQLYDE